MTEFAPKLFLRVFVKTTLGPIINYLVCERPCLSKRAGCWKLYLGWLVGCMMACAPVAYLITLQVEVRSKVCTPRDLTWGCSLVTIACIHLFFWWIVRSCLFLYAFPQKPQLNPGAFAIRLWTWLSGCFLEFPVLYKSSFVVTASSRDIVAVVLFLLQDIRLLLEPF